MKPESDQVGNSVDIRACYRVYNVKKKKSDCEKIYRLNGLWSFTETWKKKKEVEGETID